MSLDSIILAVPCFSVQSRAQIICWSLIFSFLCCRLFWHSIRFLEYDFGFVDFWLNMIYQLLYHILFLYWQCLRDMYGCLLFVLIFISFVFLLSASFIDVEERRYVRSCIFFVCFLVWILRLYHIHKIQVF